MFTSKWRVLGLVAITLLAFGCGKSKDNGSNQGSPAPMAIAGPTAQDAAAHEAKMVVSDFLNALRRGDDDKARHLLTKLAREKVEKTGLTVAPPANDSTKIEVDDATFPTPEHDIAHVPTRLVDLDDAGRPRTDRAVWVCRLEPEGWRVAGLAAYVFDGEDPLLLSFEDPEDMAKKQQWLKEELERRAKRDKQETLPSPSENPIQPDTPSQAERQPKDAFRR